VSPLSCALYYLLNSIHLRYFVKYDLVDVLNNAALAPKILARLENCISSFNRLSSSSEDDARNNEAKSIRKELKILTRSLLSGLVALSDFGGLDKLLGDLKHKSSRANSRIADDITKDRGIESAHFSAVLRLASRELLRTMRQVYKIIPDEFGPGYPDYLHFTDGFYGSNDLEALHAFNSTRLISQRISLLELCTGGDSPDVAEYYAERRARKSDDSELTRRLKTTSLIARTHVRHAREVYFKFLQLVRGAEVVSEVDGLLVCLPEKELVEFGDWCGKLAVTCNEKNDKKLLLHAAEFLGRFPPPRFAHEQIALYVSEGRTIEAALQKFASAPPPGQA